MTKQFIYTVALIVLAGNLAAAQQTRNLPEGTPVSVQTTEFLLAREIVPGQVLKIEVSEAIMEDSVVLIAKGAGGMARVVSVEEGSSEAPGKCTIVPVYCDAADGQTIQLEGEAQECVSEIPGPNYRIAIGIVLEARVAQAYTLEMGGGLPVPDFNLQPEAAVAAYEPQEFQPQEGYLSLPAGLDIPLVLSDECIPAELSVGNRLRLRVKQDVIENGKLVFRAKAPAEGVVKYLEGNKIHVAATMVHTADGQWVPVETDHSVVVEFEEDNAETLMQLDTPVPAYLSNTVRVTVR
jgi:hypothetical protein